MGKRQCELEGCTKWAIGDTEHCKAHGGGKRCQKEGCLKSAEGGGTHRCKAHGGGRRCQHEGCSKAAQLGGTQHCIAHGEAGGASTRAAPRLVAERPTASRTVAASAVRRRAALSPSLNS
jgi:hypothetical protein